MAVSNTLMVLHWVFWKLDDTADSGSWEGAIEDFHHGSEFWKEGLCMDAQQSLTGMCWMQFSKALLLFRNFFWRKKTLSGIPMLIEVQGPVSWLGGNSYFRPDLNLTQSIWSWLFGYSWS